MSAGAATTQPVVTQLKPASRPKVSYVYAVIDPKTVALAVKSFDRPTRIPEIRASIACKGVAITGGFSRNSGGGLKPLGLARTAAGTLSGVAKWKDGGVLVIAGGDVRLMRIATWNGAPSSTGMSLQSHPFVVFDGKVDEPLKDGKRWNRVGLGLLKDGRIVMIGAFTPQNNAVTLRHFAQDAIAILGTDLVSLLNMDGGPSAFMLWSDDRMLPAQGSVTTYLCAEKR